MELTIVVMQLIVSLSIFNVWVLRFSKATDWRGGEAKSMREEFEVYGLPSWSIGLVGFLKLMFAALLIVGVWLPAVNMPAAIGLAVLMLGALCMHVKVRDPISKSMPAAFLLVLCIIIVRLNM
jgi:uncharacterized membrane protein YphA (DoxX/SURF4 family)